MSSPDFLSLDHDEKQLAKCKSIIQPVLDRMDTSFYDLPAAYGLKRLEIDITPQLKVVNLKASPFSNEYYQRGNGRHVTSHCKLEDAMKNFNHGQIMFVGQPGSGKTTLLRSITRNIREGKYEKLKEVVYVFFYEGQEFVNEKETTPVEVLGFEYRILKLIRKLPRRFLFIIDSLDNLPFTFDGKERRIGLETIASTSTIMYNLISGKLFPGCRVITSSREYAMRMVQAEKVISLGGLSNPGIRALIDGYLPLEKAERMMNFLGTKSPSLVSLCRNPLFLALMLVGFENHTTFHPSTMTGIMAMLLQSFVRSKHARKKNIEDIIHKLKKVSFNCFAKGQVTFSKEELNMVGLSPEEITDLTALLLPRSVNHHESTHMEFAFCHQLVQETLSAMCIAEQDPRTFASFVSKSFCEPRFFMVWRILSGILLDSEMEKEFVELTEVYGKNDFKEKQQVLGNIFKQRLSDMESGINDIGYMNLYLSLFEAKEGAKDIIHNIKKMLMSGLTPFQTLLPEEIYAIGTIAASCEKLEELGFRVLNMNPVTLGILDECLKNSQTKIGKLDLSGNPDIGTNGMTHVGNIIRNCQVKTLILHGCRVSEEVILALKDVCKEAMLESFQWSSVVVHSVRLVSHDVLIDQKGWFLNLDHKLDKAEVTALCQLFPNISKKILLQWTIDTNGIQLMREHLGRLHGSCLQIALMRQENGVNVMTVISRKDQLPHESSMKLDPEFPTMPQTKGLKQKLNTASTAEDFSAICEQHREAASMFDGVQLAHKDLTANTLESLSIILSQIPPAELELRDCNLSASSLKALRDFGSEHKLRISKLAVSSATKFAEVVEELCKFIDEAQVGHLCIEENDLCKGHLSEISRHLSKDSKLHGLDLSYNKQMADFSSIGQIVKTCFLTELRLVNCDLTDDHIVELFEAIGDEPTLSILDMSHNLDLSEKSFGLLPKLMTSKSECLNITDCDITEDEIAALERALSGKTVTELNISNNEDLDIGGMVVLGKLITRSGTRRLSLAGCGLNQELLEAFKDSVREYQIEILDVSDNMNIGEGVTVISDLVGQCAIQELDMSDCMLTSHQVTGFTRHLHSGISMMHLNLSDSDRIVDESYTIALCGLIPYVNEELILCFSKLPQACRNLIQSHLDKHRKELKVKVHYSPMRDLQLDDLKIISNRQDEKVLTCNCDVSNCTEGMKKLSL